MLETIGTIILGIIGFFVILGLIVYMYKAIKEIWNDKI